VLVTPGRPSASGWTAYTSPDCSERSCAAGGFAPLLVGLFDASTAVQHHAAVYLRVSAAGLPAKFAVLAVTRVLRGLLNTLTHLVVSVVGFSSNVLLNLVIVYGIGLGSAGSALGTAIAQAGMVVVILRMARRDQVRLAPSPLGVLASARSGPPC
jgi:Na+-driven multidrug efflux pump